MYPVSSDTLTVANHHSWAAEGLAPVCDVTNQLQRSSVAFTCDFDISPNRTDISKRDLIIPLQVEQINIGFPTLNNGMLIISSTFRLNYSSSRHLIIAKLLVFLCL